MFKQGILTHFCKGLLLPFLLFLPATLKASFIESTIGTAVVNDATAAFYNPAGLTLLKNKQLILLGSVAYFHTNFTGQAIQSATHFVQSGTSSTNTHYYLPSFYLGIPATKNVTIGMAIVSNFFNRDVEEHSILRYAQTSNNIQDIDFVPAIGFKVNPFIALGVGLNLSHAKFVMQPLTGFPSLNIPDSQSRNISDATSWGGDAGILITPSSSTLIGFNYRSAISYNLSGKSIFQSKPNLISNQYHFKFWTPARNVFSINHFLTKKLGIIGTIQYIQSNVLTYLHIHGIATQIGTHPLIIPDATVPYHLQNIWVFTLGSHYRVTPTWIIRMAGTYLPSSANGHYQIHNGDSIVLGVSTSYDINKAITLDGSYAHAFFKNQNINISTGRNLINGVETAYRDALSLKLTVNI